SSSSVQDHLLKFQWLPDASRITLTRSSASESRLTQVTNDPALGAESKWTWVGMSRSQTSAFISLSDGSCLQSPDSWELTYTSSVSTTVDNSPGITVEKNDFYEKNEDT